MLDAAVNSSVVRATTVRCANGSKNRVRIQRITVAKRKTNLPGFYIAWGLKRGFLSATQNRSDGLVSFVI